MARAKKDPTAWRSTPAGVAAYHAVREKAQADANADGRDRGIEANDVFQQWHTFMLPQRQNRTGHELFCEVVSCERLDRCERGHGPNAR